MSGPASTNTPDRRPHRPGAARLIPGWMVGGLLLSLGLNGYLLSTQRSLRHDRDVAVLRQDSILASKLLIEQRLDQLGTDRFRLERFDAKR